MKMSAYILTNPMGNMWDFQFYP